MYDRERLKCSFLWGGGGKGAALLIVGTVLKLLAFPYLSSEPVDMWEKAGGALKGIGSSPSWQPEKSGNPAINGYLFSNQRGIKAEKSRGMCSAFQLPRVFKSLIFTATKLRETFIF